MNVRLCNVDSKASRSIFRHHAAGFRFQARGTLQRVSNVVAASRRTHYQLVAMLKPKDLSSKVGTVGAVSGAASPEFPSGDDSDAFVKKQIQRKERLTILLELRRAYRDILHASAVLGLSSPVYQPPAEQPEPLQADEDASSVSPSSIERERERELLEQEQRDKALEIVADMQLTSDQLKACLRTLPHGFEKVFGIGPDTKSDENIEQRVRDLARDFAAKLRERAAEELPLLPFGGDLQAQALVDAKNARYFRRTSNDNGITSSSMDGRELGSGTSSGGSSAIERLAVAEQFVQRRIKPALKRAQEAELGALLSGSTAYLKGLWDRLNGGGRNGRRMGGLEALGLPVPTSTRKDSELAIIQLGMELELLEGRLQGASKARETKLRRAGLPGRVQMAIQLKGLDADVLALSRLLAVRTLQLEMEHVYRSLEDEALDMTGYEEGTVVDEVRADREGYTSELDLLVANFVMLEEELTALAQALGTGSENVVGKALSSGDYASAGGELPFGIIGEDVLEKLAIEIPDMRVRAGVVDQMVFGGKGFSVTRLRLQTRESLEKVREAIDFLVRGLRLLGSDVANSGRVFTRAALGGTLKPREVSALRRTARDLLAFIPFTIILIIPLTPLGHVLIFGFIQTYFPQFFPSCFTKKRQDIMVKYEDLQRQLIDAKSQVEQAEEEEELARAALAVSRMTAPEATMSSSSNDEFSAAPGDPFAAISGLSREAAGRVADMAGSGRPNGSSRDRANGRQPAGSPPRTNIDPRQANEILKDTVQPHMEKVRALEEKMSEVLDVVNMGDEAEDEAPEQEGSKPSRPIGNRV